MKIYSIILIGLISISQSIYASQLSGKDLLVASDSALIEAASEVEIASAQPQENWQVELQEYATNVQTASNFTLALFMGTYSTTVLASCSADVAIVAGSFMIDSFPVFNFISEVFVNIVDENYRSTDFESIISLKAAAQLGRGTLGGAGLSAIEAIEFVLLWLAGEEDRSFEATKKMYASSFATAKALFSKQGQCLMSVSKLLITGRELDIRHAEAEKLWDDNTMIVPY